MQPSKINQTLLAQLKTITPSRGNIKSYYHYPCQVVLKDGRVIDRVLVVESKLYQMCWGDWPWDDPAKKYVTLEEVIEIKPSPLRLPVKLANKMYQAGESGMGYCMFTLVLKDGTKLPYVTGNAVDFPNLPPGITPAMIIDLLPHEGREKLISSNDPHQHTAEYYWCVYTD